MLLRLVAIFTSVPLAELTLLIAVGQRVGTGITVAIVIFTGVAGAALARSQGARVIQRLRNVIGSGRLPGDEMLDGVLILAGGLLLLTPGLITDLCGFAALLPVSRRLIRKWLRKAICRQMETITLRPTWKVE